MSGERRPQVVLCPQAEVHSKVVLREITPTASDLIHLDQVSGIGFDPRLQRQTITLRSGEFDCDPVIMLAIAVAVD